MDGNEVRNQRCSCAADSASIFFFQFLFSNSVYFTLVS